MKTTARPEKMNMNQFKVMWRTINRMVLHDFVVVKSAVGECLIGFSQYMGDLQIGRLMGGVLSIFGISLTLLLMSLFIFFLSAFIAVVQMIHMLMITVKCMRRQLRVW